MQDRYVGDIGDFGKFGLIRFLCGKTGPDLVNPLRLGVVWYFNDDSDSGGDFVGYLFRRFPSRKCDPGLYDKLRELVYTSRRQVSKVQRARILPDGTVYFGCKMQRSAQRRRWFGRALKAMEGVDLVFLDPDTGVAKARKSPAHVGKDELEDFVGQNNSLIVYQHAFRKENESIKHFRDIRRQMDRPVWTFKSDSRYFLIIPSKKHEERLSERLEEFRNSSWIDSRHFTEVPI